MKPILLEMSAFGPYAGVVTVDFTPFDGKLFLLSYNNQQVCIKYIQHFKIYQLLLQSN